MPDLPGQRRAAIDIGTVSTRLLVADVDSGKVIPVARRTKVTHLGEGVANTGSLSPEAVQRTVSTVEEYRSEAASLGVDEVQVIATSAARDADNGPESLAKIASAGAEPQIISGSREAYLSFRGATYSIREQDVLVADLGGGSTELIMGSVTEEDGVVTTEVETARSVDVGSRRVSDMFLKTDPPNAAEIDEALAWVTEQCRPFFDGMRKRPSSMFALAGTATSLAAIRLGLAQYDPAQVHGTSLSGGELADLKEELATLPLAQRREVLGLDPDRADVIVGGALVLEALLALAGLDAVIVSEHDILYGLILEGA